MWTLGSGRRQEEGFLDVLRKLGRVVRDRRSGLVKLQEGVLESRSVVEET